MSYIDGAVIKLTKTKVMKLEMQSISLSLYMGLRYFDNVDNANISCNMVAKQ